jgi:4a-hydroxytetrahydrobiopterin dehydratase
MRQDIRVLDRKEIFEKLKDFPGWRFRRDKIFKEFHFSDFMDLLGFINRLAPFFEENDHHPDIHIYYNRMIFELQRFDVGGFVTDRDFITAAEIERVYETRHKDEEFRAVSMFNKLTG